jgi:hypothetical protein
MCPEKNTIPRIGEIRNACGILGRNLKGRDYFEDVVVDGIFIGEMRNACRILGRNLKGRDHLEDQGMDGIFISRWILKKYDVYGLGISGSGRR